MWTEKAAQIKHQKKMLLFASKSISLKSKHVYSDKFPYLFIYLFIYFIFDMVLTFHKIAFPSAETYCGAITTNVTD